MRDPDTVGGPVNREPARARRLLTAVALVAIALVVPATVVAADRPADVAPITSDPVTTSTVAPTTTLPGVADEPADPPRDKKKRPPRGPAEQVTPTLPPPTTTTTLPPIDVVPPNSGDGRRVVYSISRQRVWAVEANGKLAKTHAVSGKRGVPAPGTYAVFSRSLYTNSLKNPAIRWMYMVRFTKGPSGDNIGFHEIPTQCDSSGRCWKLQSEAQLGQPLSGGCVRQATADALWMWNWAQLGTKVVVLP